MANRAQQIAALAREQRADRGSYRVRSSRSHPDRNRVDLVLDELTARPQDGPWVLLEGRPGWSMEDHALARLRDGVCPICHNEPLGPTDYCLGCDRTGQDGLTTWPGLSVGYAIDPTAPAEPTVYRPTREPDRHSPGRRTA